MNISVIKEENKISFVNPITTTLSDLLQHSELQGKYILCEYLNVVDGSIKLYAYADSLYELDAYIKQSKDSTKLYTAKIPKDTGIDCLEGIYQ